MRLINETKVPSELIKEMLHFILSCGFCEYDREKMHRHLRRTTVRVRYEKSTSKKTKGTYGGTVYPSNGQPYTHRINLWLDMHSKMPRTDNWPPHKKKLGFLNCTVKTMEEDVLFIFSHEIRHFWQTLLGYLKSFPVGAQGSLSSSERFVVERDAERFAMFMVRKMRKKKVFV